eukprot:6176107-Pleurochrysis_carterae.AAC.7
MLAFANIERSALRPALPDLGCTGPQPSATPLSPDVARNRECPRLTAEVAIKSHTDCKTVD